MHWVLVVFGCCLCSLAAGAPQEVPTNAENDNIIGEELSSGSVADVSMELLEASTKETSAQSSASKKTQQIEKESESPKAKQVTINGGDTEPGSTVVAQEIVTQNEESPATIQEQTLSVKPVVEASQETIVTNKPTVVTATAEVTTTKKPRRKTTVKPLAEESPVTIPVVAPTPATPTRRYPCRCTGGMCSCCTGLILENFNVPLRSRACANVTYEPEDFAFNFNLLYNNRVLYNTRMSAKNPRPACIPINRFFGIKMCVRLSNVYMSGRNVHACLDMEGFWDDESAFKYSFNCFRVGSNGIAVVRPEDGGGLPPPPDEEEQTDEDYDDSARGWTGNVEVVQN